MKLEHLKAYILSHEARGTAGTAALMVFRKLASSGIAFILAPMLGAEGYGLYAFAIACIALASTVALAGLERLAMREVAQRNETSEFGLLRGFVQSAAWVVLGVSLAVAGVGYVSLALFDFQLTGPIRTGVVVSLAIVPFVALTLLAQSVMIGFHRIVWGQIPTNLIHPGVFIILCLGAYAMGSPPSSAAEVLVLYGMAAFAGFALSAFSVLRIAPKEVWAVRPQYKPRIWVKSAALMFVIGILQAIQVNGTPILVALLADTSTTGVFALTFAVAQLVSFTHFAVDRPLSPAVVSLLARDEKQQLRRTLRRLARLALVTALPVALVLGLLGELILGIFGEDFRVGHSALVIMVTGQVINVAIGQPGIVLMMAGHERDVITAMSVRTGLLLLLNIALVPTVGLDGAALAVGLSMILANLLLLSYSWRRLGLQTTVFGSTSLSLR